ncbi:MAG: hypothetical protein ACRDPG_10635 [Nocardioidaceae bacterium]
MSSPDRRATRQRESPGTPAVVVGLDSITGLQTARILSSRGVRVAGVVGSHRHWGARTNACFEIAESPLSGPPLVSALRALAHRVGRPSVLIPCTDASVDTVSRHRHELAADYLLPLAPHPVVEVLMDKVRFARHAQNMGLPVPRTEVLKSRRDAEAFADEASYPCVLKPPYKSARWLLHTSAKGFKAGDPEELLSIYDTVGIWSGTLIAQEWVAGPEDELYSCNGYFDEHGQPLATFVARKIRQWPPVIGTSASGEECRNDEVLETTLKLFDSVGFHGLGYVEMKRDSRSGRLSIIEPNVGRPTGRSAIAEAGGVELVYTAYCHAAGLPLPPSREQRYAGAKWVDLRRDLQASIVAHHQGTLTWRDWLRWMRGPKAHAIWSPTDPLPFSVDLCQATAEGSRRLWVSIRRGRPGAASR